MNNGRGGLGDDEGGGDGEGVDGDADGGGGDGEGGGGGGDGSGDGGGFNGDADGGGDGNADGGGDGGALVQQLIEPLPVVIKNDAPVEHDDSAGIVLAQSGHGHSSPTGRHAFPAETQQTNLVAQWLMHETVLSVVVSHDVAHRGISSVWPVVESAVQRETGLDSNVEAHADDPTRVTPVRSTWLSALHEFATTSGIHETNKMKQSS